MTNPTFIITLDNGDQLSGELYPDIAPESAGNFIALANGGFYDGLTFHRCIPGFMIQGRMPAGHRYRRPWLYHQRRVCAERA